MSEQDKTLLNEIKKYLIIGFLTVFFTASAALYLFYFKNGWEHDQTREQIKQLQQDKVDKKVLEVQLSNLQKSLDELKFNWEESQRQQAYYYSTGIHIGKN